MGKQGRWPGAWPWEMNLKGQVPGPAVRNLTWIILTIQVLAGDSMIQLALQEDHSGCNVERGIEIKVNTGFSEGLCRGLDEKWQWLEWMHVKWGGEKWVDLHDIKETESIRLDLLSLGKEESNSGFSGHKSSRLVMWETGNHRVSHGSKETN